jgi:biotin transport system substrate-specific component
MESFNRVNGDIEAAGKKKLRAGPLALICCAIFATLTTACTIISVPLPFTPVPINLATLSVFMAGGLLGARYGALSQAVYVLLGAVGLPVFSNFSGGIGKIAGPTGGYILGYVVAAAVVGLIAGRSRPSRARLADAARLAFAMAAGMAACYSIGTAWFMYSMGVNIQSALVMCVIPFLLGDALKIAAGTWLCGRLRKAKVFSGLSRSPSGA